MPVLKVCGTKLDEEKKEKLAERLWSDFQSILPIPVFDIYYVDVESIYANGTKAQNRIANLEFEGSDLASEIIEKIDIAFCKSYLQICEDEYCKLTFNYHVNDGNHAGNPLGLLANQGLSPKP